MACNPLKEELPALTPRASARWRPLRATRTVRLMDARRCRAGIAGAEAAHLAVYARTPLLQPIAQVLLAHAPVRGRRSAAQAFALQLRALMLQACA